MGICESKKPRNLHTQNDEKLNETKEKSTLKKSEITQLPSIKQLPNRTKTSKAEADKLKEKYEINKNFIIDTNLLVGKVAGNVNKNYKTIKQLGEGSYGVVHLVTHNDTKQERAMKIIEKKEESKALDNEIMNEIDILKKIDHPNILKIFEFYNANKCYYLITEYCKDGELFDKIGKESPFDEKSTAYMMFQILSAVSYCHAVNIVHRDLKPENIMIAKKDVHGYRVKIIDFGTATIFEKRKFENKLIGSSYYIAPEVLLKKYDEKCDLWSCGVIMYILLCSLPPFNGNDDEEIYKSIHKGKFDLETGVWKKISSEAKDLIRKLLDKNSKTRISAEEALIHPWFKKLKTKDLLIELTPEKIKDMLNNLKKYSPDKVLQHIALAYLVHNSPQNDQVEEAFKLFHQIDKNSNGKITKEELKSGLKELFVDDSIDLEKLVVEIFHLIDGDNNGFIDYEEFVRGCIDKDKFINETIIKMGFKFFDKDGDGEITFDEIKEMFMKNLKKDVKNAEKLIKKIIQEVDLNNDGKIAFDEFNKMMKSMLSA